VVDGVQVLALRDAIHRELRRTVNAPAHAEIDGAPAPGSTARMTVVELVSVLGPIGGITGIVGGFRWFIERAERMRRADRIEEDNRRKEDRDAAERLGSVLARAAAAHARTAETLAELSDRTLRVEAAIITLASKGTNP